MNGGKDIAFPAANFEIKFSAQIAHNEDRLARHSMIVNVSTNFNHKQFNEIKKTR